MNEWGVSCCRIRRKMWNLVRTPRDWSAQNLSAISGLLSLVFQLSIRNVKRRAMCVAIGWSRECECALSIHWLSHRHEGVLSMLVTKQMSQRSEAKRSERVAFITSPSLQKFSLLHLKMKMNVPWVACVFKNPSCLCRPLICLNETFGLSTMFGIFTCQDDDLLCRPRLFGLV